MLEASSNSEPGTTARKNGVVEDGLTIIDRGALNGVLKHPVATLCAVAAAKFNQTTTLSIIDNPWETRKISPGALWFVALQPSSPVQLVTRALRNGYQRTNFPSTRHTLSVFVFRGHPTQSTPWTAHRSVCANEPF